jgi:ribose 5-phosphate isomerase A
MNLKQKAANYAFNYIQDGMLLGLGSGSTTHYFVEALGEKLQAGSLRDIRGVPTSKETEAQAHRLGIPLTSLTALGDESHAPRLDAVVDGADEVDPELQLIKGGGGALLHEKIVAFGSDRLIVIADSSKLVDRLGRFALPVEVVPSAWRLLALKLKALGCTPALRLQKGRRDPVLTQEGNHILDCAFGVISDPRRLARTLAEMPGVVEHGLFIDMADLVIVGRGTATEILTRRDAGDQLA